MDESVCSVVRVLGDGGGVRVRVFVRSFFVVILRGFGRFVVPGMQGDLFQQKGVTP